MSNEASTEDGIVADVNAELKRIDDLSEAVDQLSSDVRDIDDRMMDVQRVKTLLDLAWWFTEDAIRENTERCSAGCDRSWQRYRRAGKSTQVKFCACCDHYENLKPMAERIKRVV